MQRWVRDDRFAGQSVTVVTPLRCSLLRNRRLLPSPS